MRLSTSILATLATAHSASAALCVASGLLGLGANQTLEDTFVLHARNADGEELLVVNDPFPLPGGFFLPLYLAPLNTSLDDFTTPTFQLQNGQAYAPGGTIFASGNSSLLAPQPLFIAADDRSTEQRVVAANAVCDGKAQIVLRFSSIAEISVASAATNTTFAPGAGLITPILLNLLGVGPQVDLVVVPHASAQK